MHGHKLAYAAKKNNFAMQTTKFKKKTNNTHLQAPLHFTPEILGPRTKRRNRERTKKNRRKELKEERDFSSYTTGILRTRKSIGYQIILATDVFNLQVKRL